MTDRKTLTLRSPEDILALVPYVLGFLPEDSVVLLTAGQDGKSFHARIDLPDGPADLDLVVRTLVEATVRNGARQAMVVVYTVDACLALEAVMRLEAGLGDVGAEILVALRADTTCYHNLNDHDAPATAYDISAHPLSAQAVLDGRVTYRTRQELSDSLLPTDPDAVSLVGELCEQAIVRLAGASRHPLGPPTPATLRSTLIAEGTWGRDRVRRALAESAVLDDDELARLLAALVSVEIRDVLWAEIQRLGAGKHVRFWSDVVRRSPDEYVAAPAALLGFAAWMAGDGALAWCALDRCMEADPAYSMAILVASALRAAMPPSAWKPIDPGSLTLFAG